MRALDSNDLQQQLRLYRDLIGLAVDAILTGDSEGRFTSANKSALLLTGYSAEEMAGMNMSDLFRAEELERAPLRYDLLREEQVIVSERLLLRKDGTTVPIEMKSRMKPDGSCHAFIRDLSERRKAEEALRLSEEKFSRAFRLSPDAINITRLKDAKFLDVNEGFTKLVGWRKEEVIDHSALPGDLHIWCDEEERQQLLADLTLKGEVLGARVHLRHKEGFVRIGLMSARVIEIEGEPCIIAVTRDITEQEALLREKERLEAQVLQAQKLESLGVLAGGIAHDFNNILMAVHGHCELAKRRLPADNPARRNLEQISAAVTKAADLASQMLAYSGKGQFVVEPCDLSRLIEEMQEMLEVSVSKKAQLNFDLMPNPPCVEGDPTQLSQIILNLVINASDALENQSGFVNVSTKVRPLAGGEVFLAGSDEPLAAGDYIDLEVADNGCGMTDEVRQRIFDPFFTTKFAGRGLGMAAVIGIVRAHAGSLLVDSTPGAGSRLNVLLPVSARSVIHTQPAEATGVWPQSGRVLLVDDDTAVLEVGQQMLEELGFSVTTANDGQQALETYAGMVEQPRFVVLDLTMPRMGGEEAFLLLRQQSPALPVIISSGYNEQEVSAGFMDQGPVGFLKKPYQLLNLQLTINRLLISI